MILKKVKQASARHLRIAEIIRKAVSEVLLKNELPLDPNFSFPLSVVNTEMSSDLRTSYVYVTTHEDIKKNEILQRLEGCKKFISKEISKLIDLKFSPKIIFRNDLDIEKHHEIGRLLQTEKVQSDIKKNE